MRSGRLKAVSETECLAGNWTIAVIQSSRDSVSQSSGATSSHQHLPTRILSIIDNEQGSSHVPFDPKSDTDPKNKLRTGFTLKLVALEPEDRVENVRLCAISRAPPHRFTVRHPEARSSVRTLPPGVVEFEDRSAARGWGWWTMSIAAMTRLAAEREGQKTIGTEAAADAGKEVRTATEKIAAFIPSEAIGFYVAGFGIFSPGTQSGKWVLFFVSLGFLALVMSLNYLLEKKRAKSKSTPAPTMTQVLTLLAFAVVAFAAWAAAMPDTPFLTFGANATAVGGWAVIGLAVIMYKVAELVDVAPVKR